jgi:hypothetical protein
LDGVFLALVAALGLVVVFFVVFVAIFSSIGWWFLNYLVDRL